MDLARPQHRCQRLGFRQPVIATDFDQRRARKSGVLDQFFAVGERDVLVEAMKALSLASF